MAPGKSDIPGNSGTRNLEDNLSDLKAQVAANTKGIQLVGDLINEYSLTVVQAYMGHIQVRVPPLHQHYWPSDSKHTG
jgi:5-oxoprolinase (ATP-hydrolysing)